VLHVAIYLLLYCGLCISYRPNVLLIILDDFKPALGSYGDSEAYTPYMDKLASESFVFTQAYAQQALCAPSRNSFLTSRRPDTLHFYDFYSYWRQFAGNFTTLPQYFKEHGYHSHSVGKVFHPGISSNFSDDQPYSWSQTPFHPKSEAFKNAKVCLNPDGSLGMNLICPVQTEFQPLGTLPDIESMKEAMRFIQQQRTNEDKLPYFLAVGFHKPHIPLKFPDSFLAYHPLDNISLPINRFRPSLLPSVAWNPWTDIRKRDDIRKLNASFPYGPLNDDILRLIIQAYYSSVSYVDDLIGKVLREINFKNTIVVLTGDHGWSLGQHGEFSKYSNFEQVTQVPLIIHVPHLSSHQVAVKSLVELVDIFPTLVDLTQVGSALQRCPETKQLTTCTEGESLVPVMIEALEKQKVRGKSCVFTQYPRPGVFPTWHPNSDKPRLNEIKAMGYSIKTKRYRYCEWMEFNSANFTANWSKVYATELYDHLIDPEENMNLGDKTDLEFIIKRLSRKLKRGWRHA
ncbi:hypothetical protein D910_12210, partial [Dendroctonus ponderosae]